MAYTTINKSSEHFNTKLWTGNATDNTTISGVGFQPDFTWIKERSNISSHHLQDSVRGATKALISNSSGAENISSTRLKSWNSDGFVIGTSGAVNASSDTYASWNWLANGTGSANTAGSINSTVSVNTTSGFSIVKYTANGTQGATVGHGLGVTPKMMMFKNLDSTLGDGEVDWGVYHSSLTATNFLKLNTTQAQINSDGTFNDTEPSNTLFTLGGGSQGDRFATNRTGDDYIAYCFADVQGFSKMGSYTGNANNGDGTFVYTGFKPAFIMVKNTARTQNWSMHDSKRPGYNEVNQRLQANLSDAESSNNKVDLLSNGFKWKTNDGDTNGYAENHIYMAFAEAPLVGTNNVPCTAR